MKKVGKLNGKVVVSGDKNLVTANQIHYEESEGNINLSERKDGELKSVAGAPDDFLSYRYFKEGTVLDLKITELIGNIYGTLTSIEYSDYSTLSLPFIFKIKYKDYNHIKGYEIKFISTRDLNDWISGISNSEDLIEFLGVSIPKYLNITLVSSAPAFGNVYPEYNIPFFECLEQVMAFIQNDEATNQALELEKLLQPFEITREEFLNIGI